MKPCPDSFLLWIAFRSQLFISQTDSDQNLSFFGRISTLWSRSMSFWITHHLIIFILLISNHPSPASCFCQPRMNVSEISQQLRFRQFASNNASLVEMGGDTNGPPGWASCGLPVYMKHIGWRCVLVWNVSWTHGARVYMYLWLYVYAQVHVEVNTHKCINVQMNICINVNVYIYIYVSICLTVYKQQGTCISVNIYVSMGKCVCICIWICICECECEGICRCLYSTNLYILERFEIWNRTIFKNQYSKLFKINWRLQQEKKSNLSCS